MRYNVTLESVLRFMITVDANSEQEAELKALEEYGMEHFLNTDREDVLDIEEWDTEE